MELTTVCLATVVLVVICFWFSRHDPRLPPCPVRPLPFVGHLLYLEKNPRALFARWRQQCGEIYSLYLGRSLVVMLNGYDLVKEALVKNGDACIDRPYSYIDAATGAEGRGITFSSGNIWREHKLVTVNIFRSLGVTRNILAEKVAEIVAINNEALASLKGAPTNINNILTTSVANVICSIIIGHRFSTDDKQFIQCCEYFRSIVVDLESTNLVNFYKFLQYLPGDMFGAKSIGRKAKFILENFASRFVRRKGYQEYDVNNLDNFVSLYVFEMNKKIKSGEPTTMSEENLIKTVFDLFGAGMETMSTSLLWCVLYMVHYPEVQEKVYLEIEKEVGVVRLPNMSDKSRLPYMNAVIMEVQRISSIVPLNLTRFCSKNITIGGYTVPAGTQIIPSLDSILFDKKIWGDDVDSFKPERFLDEDRKVRYPEQFVPFSLGKRMCIGEAMAKMELFMFFGAMIQKFKFIAPDPAFPPPLEALFGLNVTPVPFKVRAIERKMAA
ncbi:hypothetical protein BsWGS_06373 [Bradybaena similaris]